MTAERATIRPVTLSRLVEVTHACEGDAVTTQEVESALAVSHRRARETILEARRIGLLDEVEGDDEPRYVITRVGEAFLVATRREAWSDVSDILAARSPHYGAFLDIIETTDPADLETLLDQLETTQQYTPYTFNQASVEVVGDWAERLGRVQRNAFTGSYYTVSRREVPANFHFIVLETYDELEQTAGVDLRQRYLSIPRLRETVCERMQCTRSAFDDGLLTLCQQNVGKLELSGAPLDTAAKDAALGIKRIDLADDGNLVSTSQSTQRVMAGVELYGKQYYYLAVYEPDITFDQEGR